MNRGSRSSWNSAFGEAGLLSFLPMKLFPLLTAPAEVWVMRNSTNPEKRKTGGLFPGLSLLCLSLLPIPGFLPSAPLQKGKLHLAAKEDFPSPSKAVFLESGSWYRFPERDIPADLVGRNDPARTVAFGREVLLAFSGLDPAARYELTLTFLSDQPRAERILAGGQVLEDRLSLGKGKILVKRWPLPPSAYAKGTLEVRIERLQGPNAVVSALEIWSSSPARLKPRPFPEVPRPRLSPPPVEIPGIFPLRLPLGGAWRFHPSPEKEFWKKRDRTGKGWKSIQVPGEWVMQGFHVKPGTAAGYRREFRLPHSWKGVRVMLRCDGVYSKARVYLNGRPAGTHEGGFTPFELDVTDHLKPGRNEIALAVTNESIQDTLSCGSQYAAHQLGGITRRIYLFPLPSLHFASFHAYPSFEKNGRDARLEVVLLLASRGRPPGGTKKIAFTLSGPLPSKDRVLSASFPLPAPAGRKTFLLPLPSPEKWDPEHPNLYLLEASLLSGGRLLEKASRKVGFREIRVQGNRLLVNGVPVKLRGANRHEIDPLRGRSLSPGEWRRDALLFKKANVNYIRTSHYPPDEAFIDACDEIGLFVEEEAPLCWVGHPASPIWKEWNPQDKKFYPHLVRPILEMIERDATHPSVLIWSLANESVWTRNFAEAFRVARLRDPTRPFTFHDQCWGSFNNHGSCTQVANIHYPGPGGPERAAKEKRPVLFGEYYHVADYDRSEVKTDPGIRDIWGVNQPKMWEKTLSVPACLGGAIWAGIDDIFLLPSGKVTGYGPWGLLDFWRRPKPEYWNTKKTYSPVKIPARSIEPGTRPIRLEILNRHLFTDLSEVKISWSLEERGGRARISLPPGAKGVLEIDPGIKPEAGRTLEIRFVSPQGFLEDIYRIPVGPVRPKPPLPHPGGNLPPVKLTTAQKAFLARGKDFLVSFSRSTGLLEGAEKGGRPVLSGGPFLMVLPLKGGPCSPDFDKNIPFWNDTLQGWKAESVRASASGDSVRLLVKGSYGTARGSYTFTVRPEGKLVVKYNFVILKKVNPRQWGPVFSLPKACAVLSWEKKSPWSFYPPDHIGRPRGTARAFPPRPQPGPWARKRPDHPWSMDANALGTRDFRSTKKDVYWAALRAPSGEGILLEGEGKRSARAWLDKGYPHFLVCGFSTMGMESFVASHSSSERRPLSPGDVIRDEFVLDLLGPGKN